MLARRVNGNPINRLAEEMNSLFDTFFDDRPATGWTGTRSIPAVNIWENDENFFVEAELPGMKMEDIDVTVTGNQLTMKGERKEAAEENVSYHRREWSSGSFHRVITLPSNVETGDVSAQLKDGVLMITLPKAAELRPKKIEVKCLPA